MGGVTAADAPIGILMLETGFPRVAGDVGNAATWPFPVVMRTVRDASAERVVQRRAAGLLDRFIEAGQALVREGAVGITTTCGFLSLLQRDLAAALPVPVAASCLAQIGAIEALLPPRRCVGVITIDAGALTPAHLAAAGARADVPVVGTEAGGELTRVVMGDEPTLDVAAATRDVLAAGERLVRAHPRVGAIVLECANMPPYAAALARHLSLPVYDFYSFVTWFRAGLRPRAF
jgi:hypothetical protein